MTMVSAIKGCPDALRVQAHFQASCLSPGSEPTPSRGPALDTGLLGRGWRALHRIGVATKGTLVPGISSLLGFPHPDALHSPGFANPASRVHLGILISCSIQGWWEWGGREAFCAQVIMCKPVAMVLEACASSSWDLTLITSGHLEAAARAGLQRGALFSPGLP